MAYIFLFIIITIFTIIAQNIYKKAKIISYIISGLCILLLSIFAGIRDFSVGSDVLYYGVKFFDKAFLYDSFWNYYLNVNSDFLYLLINYIVSKFTNDFHVVLFVLQFISSTLIYIIAYRENDKSSMWMVILAYLLIWFNSSLNILRQSIAMMIILYAYKYVEEEKNLKFLLATFVAYLFHSSAFICIIIPIFKKFLKMGKSGIKLNILLVLLTSFIVIFYNDILNFAIEHSLVPKRYLFYESTSIIDFKYAENLLKIALLFFIFQFYHYFNESINSKLLIALNFFEFLSFQLGNISKFAVRLSYYFLMFQILVISRIDYSLRNAKGKVLFRLIIITILLLRWYFRNYLWEYDQTIPYIISK